MPKPGFSISLDCKTTRHKWMGYSPTQAACDFLVDDTFHEIGEKPDDHEARRINKLWLC